MELQQLRYVVAVDDERSFTRAAHRCYVVQSALSHQIKALERELGVKLFARTSRRVEPTAAGSAFIEAARVSVAAADEAAVLAQAASGQIRGSLTMGVVPTVTAVDVAAELAAFHERHHDVTISLRMGGSEELMTAIANGAMDVAVLGLGEASLPHDVEFRVLSRHDLVAAVSPQHRLATRSQLDLADLAEETFVDFPLHSPGRVPSDAAFDAAGLARTVAFESTSVDVMTDLIASGLVVALLPEPTVARDPRLRAVRVVDAPRRVEYLAWRAFNPRPAARAFIAELGDSPSSATNRAQLERE